MQIFVKKNALGASFLFVIRANGVANSAWIAEKRAGGVETLAGYFRNCAVELHLSANLIAFAPRRFRRSVL